MFNFYCLIGLVIEEITEDVDAAIPGNDKRSSTENLTVQSELNNCSKNQSAVNNRGITTNSEALHALKDDSEAIRLACIHKRVINGFLRTILC